MTQEQQHPIGPPPSLVGQWLTEAAELRLLTPSNLIYLATQAAQWAWDQRGAINEAELQKARDEDLEACCEWLSFYSATSDARDLRAARRPKPPSLKEQALEQLDSLHADLKMHGFGTNTDTIRRALEALND